MRKLFLHQSFINSNGLTGRLLDEPGINLQNLILDGVDLTRARIPRACLDGASLRYAKLIETDLNDASLILAVVERADFSKADVRLACFADTAVHEALSFEGAQTEGTQWTEDDLWANVRSRYEAFRRANPHNPMSLEEFIVGSANQSMQAPEL